MDAPTLQQYWENYPESLHLKGCHAYGYNASAYGQQLKADSQRLFIQAPDQIAVKFLEFGKKGQEIVLQSAATLDAYLKNEPKEQTATRLILIPQQSSWGRLVVDEVSVRKILSRFDIFPPFIDVIRSFGQKIDYEDESAGIFRFREDADNSVSETTFVIKHAEEHGRQEATDPWSLRQIGVYHRSDVKYGNLFIILNPSLALRQRFKRMKLDCIEPSTGDIYVAIMSCAMENWRWYISHMEKRYLYMKDKAQLSHVDDHNVKNVSPAEEVHFEDTQEIQVIQDKAQQLAHSFDVDRVILGNLRRSLYQADDASAVEFVDGLVVDAEIQMSRILRMLRRLDGTIALIRTTLDFRSLSKLQHTNIMMAQMMNLSRNENQMIVNLSKKSSRDTDTLKMITFLGLIYLPASFVSSMMGMEYITSSHAAKRFSIHIASEFWIFVVLTVVLLIVTLGSYFWYSKTTAEGRRREETQMSRV